MNVIQQTAKIDSTRRVLTFERPLPESVGTGRVDISLFIRPQEKEHLFSMEDKTASLEESRDIARRFIKKHIRAFKELAK